MVKTKQLTPYCTSMTCCTYNKIVRVKEKNGEYTMRERTLRREYVPVAANKGDTMHSVCGQALIWRME